MPQGKTRLDTLKRLYGAARGQEMALYGRVNRNWQLTTKETKKMKRTPTTNPQIDGKPMSFMRLGSKVAGPLSHNRSFKDSRGRAYIRDGKGTVYRAKQGEGGK
jgi:hypothetical protein